MWDYRKGKKDEEEKEKVLARENEGTERDFEGVGRDMSIPLKLFLEMRTSTETYFRLWKNN